MLCFPFIVEEETHSSLLHLHSLGMENVLSIMTNPYNGVVMVSTAVLSGIVTFCIEKSSYLLLCNYIGSPVIKASF